MVQEGLREIYNLFVEKINSTFNQIIDKLINQPKFQNANNYFLKDFPFFYFCVKFYALSALQRSEFDINKESEEIKSETFTFLNNYRLLNIKKVTEAPVIDITRLKNKFTERLQMTCEENFSRGFNLIKLQEKNLELYFNNNLLLKETITNENITLYLINYIKQMSWSYIDIQEEFNLIGQEIILDSDLFLFEVSNLFSEKLYEHYFQQIKLRLGEIYIEIQAYNINLNENSNSEKEEKACNSYEIDKNKGNINLLIFKYFYYLGILNKMNDILLNFQTSNIRFLITDKLKENTDLILNNYINFIFNEFLKRIMKDLKFILINKDFSSLY